MIVRKNIKEFITANGASTETSIVAACVAQGAKERRVERVIERMTRHGKLVKSGENYDLAP